MSASLDQARLLVRLRETRLRAAHARLAHARHESRIAEATRQQAIHLEDAAARATRTRRHDLADHADQAEARLMLLSCATIDHDTARTRLETARTVLAERRAAESDERGRVIAAEARREALATQVDRLRRIAARRAEEAIAIEAEDDGRSMRT
jgi:hypothetical protein